MRIVQRGQGEPLVLVPGLQGRWEYMLPAIDALAAHFQVITFPLCDEPSAGFRFDRDRGLDNYVTQVADALDEVGVQRAAICGVSFGGIVALRFAAARPDRTRALILVSTPGPDWHLRPRHEIYARAPWIFGLLFLAETPFRVGRELRAALPDRRARRRFARTQLRMLARAPVSVTRMAARARLIAATGRSEECTRISAPCLIVHGDPQLDHIVNVHGTSDYGRLIRDARVVMLEDSGHLGSITRASVFAATVREFIDGSPQEHSTSAA